MNNTDEKYVVFTKGDSYFITSVNGDNRKLVVYEYMKFIGSEKESNILEKMCTGATEFTFKEIVEYANSRIYYREDKITSIVELGEIIYIA